MVEAVRRTFGDDAAVLHDDDTVGGLEDLVQDMRDEDDGSARGDEAADMVEHLTGEACIERRCRFVQDHQPRGSAGIGKGQSDFDHLPFGDRKISHGPAAVDAMAGEDRVEALLDDLRSPQTPAESTESAMYKTGVLNDGEVGAEGQLLKDATHASVAGGIDAVAFLPLAVTRDDSVVRREAAIDHADDRGLAGPIMSDEPNAFAGHDTKRDAVERLDCAEAHFGAVDRNDRLRYVVHTARHHLLNKTAARSSTATRQPPGDFTLPTR